VTGLIGLASAGGGWQAPAALLRRSHVASLAFDVTGPWRLAPQLDATNTTAQQQRRRGNCTAAVPAAGAAAEAAGTAVARIAAYNRWKNDLVLGALLPAAWRAALPHPVAIWLRCVACAVVTYLIPGALWLAAAARRGRPLSGPGGLLASEALRHQVRAALSAIPTMCWMPALTELAAERGLTRAYLGLSEVRGGLPAAAACFVAYMMLVEFLVYWAHRVLHAVPFLYRNVHALHHSYNKEHALSPFAGLAFHWADGVLQGLPYSLLLALLPVQLTVYEMLVWVSSFW
jgi:lathosterol oxidase